MMTYWVQWTSETRRNGMPTPEQLEAEGWERVHFHPNYRRSWLMRKDDDAIDL